MSKDNSIGEKIPSANDATQIKEELTKKYNKYSKLGKDLVEKVKKMYEEESLTFKDLAHIKQSELLITYYNEYCLELMHGIYVMNLLHGEVQKNENVEVIWSEIIKVVLIKHVSNEKKLKTVWFLREDKTIFKRVDIEFNKQSFESMWKKSKESTKTWFQFPQVGIQYELYKVFNLFDKNELWTLYDNKLGTGKDGMPIFRTIYNCHVINGPVKSITWFDEDWKILECKCGSPKFDKDGIQLLCECQEPPKYLSTK